MFDIIAFIVSIHAPAGGRLLFCGLDRVQIRDTWVDRFPFKNSLQAGFDTGSSLPDIQKRWLRSRLHAVRRVPRLAGLVM